MRNSHLYSPLFVFIFRVIQCPVTMYSQLKSRTIPLNHEISSRTIRLIQHQIKYNSFCISFYFKVILPVTIRIEKNFKIIVMVNNCISLIQLRLNIIFLQRSSNIKILIIPQHFSRSIITRLSKSFSTYIYKRRSGLCLLPVSFIQFSIYLNFSIYAITYIPCGQS